MVLLAGGDVNIIVWMRALLVPVRLSKQPYRIWKKETTI